MSAKNSGATREQYAEYNKDERKAGGPVARRVVLEVWSIEEKQPEQHEAVLVWSRDGYCVGIRFYIKSALGGFLWAPSASVGMSRETHGTSWAYIPNITTEELT